MPVVRLRLLADLSLCCCFLFLFLQVREQVGNLRQRINALDPAKQDKKLKINVMGASSLLFVVPIVC